MGGIRGVKGISETWISTITLNYSAGLFYGILMSNCSKKQHTNR